jgi:adenine deaminase
MRTRPVDPELLSVARGDRPADVLLTNARIVNVFSGEIVPGAIALRGERIASVGPVTPAEKTIDLAGAHVAPGFIDAHMHIESTMMPPSEFVTLAVPHATTGVVADPHEIANVLGIPGIRWMMANARGLPCNIFFTASSCVPSCHLETSGANLDADDLEPLFDDPDVVALAEMMNFPGVVFGDVDVLKKVSLGLKHRIVDGHCPGLRGKHLQAYAAAGISSDHESTTAEEALEKLRAGLRVYIREGSAARNLDALLPLVNDSNYHRFCWCTDDRHPADLQHEGHIDHVVRRAVAKGMDPVRAITLGTLMPAQHYALPSVGAIAPGYFADLFIFDDLKNIRPREVYFHGQPVARDNTYLPEPRPLKDLPGPTVRLPRSLSIESFHIPARAMSPTIRVIAMDPHQIVTGEKHLQPAIEKGQYVADPDRDILKLAVIERHGRTSNVGLGFVTGFRFRRGAIASTVGHDSHNLAVVGDNDRDMLIAAKELERVGGGQCVVAIGSVLATLPLPIAGLMSDQPSPTLIAQQRILLDAAKALGCPHEDPFMPLSFLPLPVIPKLKLSDKGLVDVEKFDIVPLEL